MLENVLSFETSMDLLKMTKEDIETYVRGSLASSPEHTMYNIGTAEFVCMTGLEGKVRFEVTLLLKLKEIFKDNASDDRFSPSGHKDYTEV